MTWLFLDKCPKKTPTRENQCNSEGFYFYATVKLLVQTMDAQLAIQTTSKYGQNYLRDLSFFHKKSWQNFLQKT